MALDKLMEKIVACQNPTVAGLDPKLSYIPSYIKEKARASYGNPLEAAAAAVLEFNKGLIDALCEIVPAVKPQCAYYELLGWQGMKALQETISYAQEKGLYVITDGKRNDIGSTMEAYATAHLSVVDLEGISAVPFGGDALTVNAYLGSDGIEPLLTVCRKENKGIFILVKTSNPSSGELQDRTFENGQTLYASVGELCETWGKEIMGQYGYSGAGAVVGATYPEQLAELRRTLPHTFFLVPGYGAQGGSVQSVQPAFDTNGMGAIINASRSIMCAWQKQDVPQEDYAKAAAQEALRMRDELMHELGTLRLHK